MLANHPKTSPADEEPADMKERKEKATPTRTATHGNPQELTLELRKEKRQQRLGSEQVEKTHKMRGALPLTERP